MAERMILPAPRGVNPPARPRRNRALACSGPGPPRPACGPAPGIRRGGAGRRRGPARDRLLALKEQLTFDGILAELNSGSLIPHERVMNALRLLCEEVMPRFK